MFITETGTFGFQNVFADAEKQCWALLQTSPLVHKLRTEGLGLRICEPIFYRKHLRICGKKIEIYRESANQQHHWDRFCNFQKNTFLRFNVLTDLDGCISKVQHPLTEFLCCKTIISQRCCYSCSKMIWLKVKKLPKACFCEEKLRLFEVAKGCTRRLL